MKVPFTQTRKQKRNIKVQAKFVIRSHKSKAEKDAERIKYDHREFKTNWGHKG